MFYSQWIWSDLGLVSILTLFWTIFPIFLAWLPSKALAEYFRQLKYSQLNSDVFTGTLSVTWSQLIQEYVNTKKVRGNQPGKIYDVSLTLRHFERIVGKCNSKQVTQHTIDKFILKRQKEIKRSTVNKDIRNIKAFVNWYRRYRYINGDISIKLLKEDDRPVKS